METISNPSLSKVYRKNPNRNVVGWYKMSFVVDLFGFGLEERCPVKKGKNTPFMFSAQHPFA